MGSNTTEPLCSTMSSFVLRPSGVLRVSRLMLKARPCSKVSDSINSNGINNPHWWNMLSVDDITKPGPAPGLLIIIEILWNTQLLPAGQGDICRSQIAFLCNVFRPHIPEETGDAIHGFT